MKRLALTLLLSAAMAAPAAAQDDSCDSMAFYFEAVGTAITAIDRGEAVDIGYFNQAEFDAVDATALTWPDDIFPIFDEASMLMNGIETQGGMGSAGDAEGLRGYAGALLPTFTERCGSAAVPKQLTLALSGT